MFSGFSVILRCAVRNPMGDRIVIEGFDPSAGENS
jgi:hypothetical protein